MSKSNLVIGLSVLSVFASFLFSIVVLAATTPAAPASAKKTTDVSFEDVLVQGKYHFSDESVTTVENDKVLDALLGVRTDFKDRLKKSSARH